MRLTHVHIEHFRGIPRLTLPLDPVTVVIGENNHGKTSILDVLGLCLGRPGGDRPTRFREHDFHRPREGTGPVQPIRIRLSFSAHDAHLTAVEERALGPALVDGGGGAARLHVEFVGMPDGRPMEVRFLDDGGEALDPQPPPPLLDELRRLHPVLLLRFAHHLPFRPPSTGEDAGKAEDGAEDPARSEKRSERALEGEIARVYRELTRTRGPVPDDHLDQGMEAARQLLRRVEERRGGRLGPLRGMLARLVEQEEGLARAGSGSHTLGLLMVLGALLEVRGASHLAAEAHPVIAIEEPEVHLHPILLASVWDVIESLSAQTLVTTHSGELLASVPLHNLRRLARRNGGIEVHRLARRTLSELELRRVGYHIRAKRGGVLFARCWLLVEGESEFWLLRSLAHVLGWDLDAEGVQLVEFAQCGVAPLVKLANDLGIEWHLLTDGDESGSIYIRDARKHLDGREARERITQLDRSDVEDTLWHHGYEGLYRKAAGVTGKAAGRARGKSHRWVIGKAVRNFSKPYLALSVAEAARDRGPEGVPEPLRAVVETAVRLAREAIDDGRS